MNRMRRKKKRCTEGGDDLSTDEHHYVSETHNPKSISIQKYTACHNVNLIKTLFEKTNRKKQTNKKTQNDKFVFHNYSICLSGDCPLSFITHSSSFTLDMISSRTLCWKRYLKKCDAEAFYSAVFLSFPCFGLFFFLYWQKNILKKKKELYIFTYKNNY